MKQETCFGTAWAEGRASVQKPSEPLAPGTELQFARRGLDSSFLMDLYVILSGTTYDEIAAAAKSGQPIDGGQRKIGGAQLAPYHTAVFYECSAPFRTKMAALSSERIKDIAQNWYALLHHPNTQSSPERTAYRLEIVQNLAALARVAEDRNSRVLLQTEYRMTE